MSGSTPSTEPEVAAATGRRQVHVAAGALTDAQGRVLVTRRPDGVHQGGLWEFPGGKLEPGEDVASALARELREELGIEVRAARPLIRIHHDYGDRHVLLDVHLVTAFDGTPRGLEGQPLDWLAPEAMDPARFPAADQPIIDALRLPERYLITGADPRDEQAFLSRLTAALARGARLVQLRAHDLDDAAYADLADAAQVRCRQAGARLVLNRDAALAERLGADGLHLRAAALARLRTRPPLPLVGASCHNAADLAHAAALGLDYAVLGPVLPTATHPDAQTLGWEGFAALADTAALPVYALGGMRPEHLAISFARGAQGIAAIRGLGWGGQAPAERGA
jgi:8-oxo-dGTP diphosphatase